jgi:hypothetical protein
MKNRHFGRGRGITKDAGEDTITNDLYDDPEFMALEGYQSKKLRRPGHLSGVSYWFNNQPRKTRPSSKR